MEGIKVCARPWTVPRHVSAPNYHLADEPHEVRHSRHAPLTSCPPPLQDAVQPELGRAHHVGHVPPDQTAATDLATKAVPSLSAVTSSRSAVNHLLKSVVREISTLRSVGTGGGRPPPVTRWCAQ